MIGVTAPQETTSESLRDPKTGPQIAFKTGRARAAKQIAFQFAPIRSLCGFDKKARRPIGFTWRFGNRWQLAARISDALVSLQRTAFVFEIF